MYGPIRATISPIALILKGTVSKDVLLGMYSNGGALKASFLVEALALETGRPLSARLIG